MLVSACAIAASAIFLIVLVTKLAVLNEDAVARVGLLSWFVAASVLALGARAAWRHTRDR